MAGLGFVEVTPTVSASVEIELDGVVIRAVPISGEAFPAGTSVAEPFARTFSLQWETRVNRCNKLADRRPPSISKNTYRTADQLRRTEAERTPRLQLTRQW